MLACCHRFTRSRKVGIPLAVKPACFQCLEQKRCFRSETEFTNKSVVWVSFRQLLLSQSTIVSVNDRLHVLCDLSDSRAPRPLFLSTCHGSHSVLWRSALSNGLPPKSNGLQPTGDGLQPNSDGLPLRAIPAIHGSCPCDRQ